MFTFNPYVSLPTKKLMSLKQIEFTKLLHWNATFDNLNLTDFP